MLDISSCNLLCTTWQGQLTLFALAILTIWQEVRHWMEKDKRTIKAK